MSEITVCVLIACMHQEKKMDELIERSNLQSDAVIINQTDFDGREELVNHGNLIRIVHTKERGLSRSRNMALLNAEADYCVVCDDDERMCDNYVQKIQAAAQKSKDDIFIFNYLNPDKSLGNTRIKHGSLNLLSILHVVSFQIVIKRESILANAIHFDVETGCGASAAGGEENLFLADCLRKNLKITAVDNTICILYELPSSWRKFDKQYFIDRGIFTRKIFGIFFALLYALYFATVKYPLYRRDFSFIPALLNTVKGIYKR